MYIANKTESKHFDIDDVHAGNDNDVEDDDDDEKYEDDVEVTIKNTENEVRMN